LNGKTKSLCFVRPGKVRASDVAIDRDHECAQGRRELINAVKHGVLRIGLDAKVLFTLVVVVPPLVAVGEEKF